MVWSENPIGVYGFRDRGGKFKIREKPAPGRRTKGSVCMEASWKVFRIYKLFKDIGALPQAAKEFKKYDRKNLLRDIRAQPGLGIFFEDLESNTDDKLRSILYLHTMDKKEMCSVLEKWFIDNNLYYDYRT